MSENLSWYVQSEGLQGSVAKVVVSREHCGLGEATFRRQCHHLHPARVVGQFSFARTPLAPAASVSYKRYKEDSKA